MTYPQQPGQPQPFDPNQQYGGPPPPTSPLPVSPRRRRVWPWVLLAVVLVPILGFAACTALIGGAVSAVDDARKGGTVAIGETFTYASGLALTVAAPAPYTPDNEFEVPTGQIAFEAPVTIVNGSDQPVSAALITKNATVAGQPAPEVVGSASFATQDIAPGQQLVLPFRFAVPAGMTGALQIAVTGTFNEPVFFTGTLG